MVNALVCIQSQSAKRLIEEFESWLIKIDEEMSEEHKLISIDGLAAFNDLLKIDYTTLKGVTGLKVFRDKPKLLNLYISFSQHLDQYLPEGVSLADIKVVNQTGVNIKINLDFY